MNPGGRTRCQKCVGKKKRAVEVARAEDQRQLRLAKQEEEGRNIVAWRDAQVSWYKSEILSRQGADRIRFFESHPLANICAWD